MLNNDLLVISGPTAVGKTDISIRIAQELHGEILSADSMQIYKGMDIGSAKISKDDMKNIPHYLIDIINPHESFSAAEYKNEAVKLIQNISNRGKLPIIAGGTGLYIDSIICNYSFTEANKDSEYREYLQEMAALKGNEHVHNLLKDIDNVSFNKLHPNNLKRIIRALEVYKLTNKPFSTFEADKNKYDIPYNLHYFVLTMDREQLYNRINKRVEHMIDNGLIDEVLKLKESGCTSEMQSMKGIGYKEILYYLDGKISLEAAIDMIKQGSRNYAKRQLTWFRKDPRVQWIDKDMFKDDNKIVEHIISKFK